MKACEWMGGWLGGYWVDGVMDGWIDGLHADSVWILERCGGHSKYSHSKYSVRTLSAAAVTFGLSMHQNLSVQAPIVSRLLREKSMPAPLTCVMCSARGAAP